MEIHTWACGHPFNAPGDMNCGNCDHCCICVSAGRDDRLASSLAAGAA